MKTKGVRLYGKNDLRLEEFELPEMKEDEILVKNITDSICMSTYKLAQMGQEHKRAHVDMGNHPCIMGHEFCGEIVAVGKKWQNQYKPGDRFIMETDLKYQGKMDAPGFTFPYCGGNSHYMIIPHMVMELECLLKCDFEHFYFGSLAEPMACIASGFHAFYHKKPDVYEHEMGLKKGGKMAILAGAGPMGLGAVEYAIHNLNKNPSLLVVTDIDEKRLERARNVLTAEKAAEAGVELHYVNTAEGDPVETLMNLTGGTGFDDILVMAPVSSVIAQADKLLAKDGCLNFFAGPTDAKLEAPVNFYRVHYDGTHVTGTTGSEKSDMIEVADLMMKGLINPSIMITHIGGLDAVVDTVLNLPKIPGGKKMIYNQIELPLIALDDLSKSEDPVLKKLGEIYERNNRLWCGECEEYLLENFKK